MFQSALRRMHTVCETRFQAIQKSRRSGCTRRPPPPGASCALQLIARERVALAEVL